MTMGLHVLLDSGKLDEDCVEATGLMRDGVTYISDSMNDVLAVQTLEEGLLELNKQPHNPRDLVATVVRDFQFLLTSKNVTVRVLFGTNTPDIIECDGILIRRCLENYLSNAIKFSPSGGHLVVKVTYDDVEADAITFTVIDEGKGIPPADQQYLFAAFVQLRPGELTVGRGGK